MLRLPQNMFLLNSKQDHFSNKKLLVSTPQFIEFTNCDIFTQINKGNPIRHLWWLFSETRMHCLPENIFLLTLRQDHFSKKNFFSCYSPIYRLRKQQYFHLIQQKRPYETGKTFLLSLGKDHFSNKKILVPTPR